MTIANSARARAAQGRAAVATAAILKIINRALRDWMLGHGAPANFGDVAGEIETLLAAAFEQRDCELLDERAHEAQLDFLHEMQS